jgi:DNA-binding CsgD family transcriptional regulator
MFSARQWKYVKKGFHLTDRQVQVAKLVCEGMNNDQIAKKLHITYNTARTHVAHICAKVAVRGRAELILRLIKVSRQAK